MLIVKSRSMYEQTGAIFCPLDIMFEVTQCHVGLHHSKEVVEPVLIEHKHTSVKVLVAS